MRYSVFGNYCWAHFIQLLITGTLLFKHFIRSIIYLIKIALSISDCHMIIESGYPIEELFMVVYTEKMIATLKSINPSTLEVIAEVPITSAAEIDQTFAASRQAFLSWRAISLSERLQKIKSFHRLLVERKDEIARLITTEIGKPILESYLGELSGPLDTCLWLQKKGCWHSC